MKDILCLKNAQNLFRRKKVCLLTIQIEIELIKPDIKR